MREFLTIMGSNCIFKVRFLNIRFGVQSITQKRMNILTLDGGGSKGVYTLGILKELEATLTAPIHKTFNYIYGTSTGSIIAALLGLGWDVAQIEKLYFDLIPRIMGPLLPHRKSALLRSELINVLGNRDFTSFQTGIGIVATNIEEERPLVSQPDDTRAAQQRSHRECSPLGGLRKRVRRVQLFGAGD